MFANRWSTILLRSGLLAGVLSLCWLAYQPGLSGGFLFDDFANLPILGEFGRVDNATTLLRYVTSGFADPTGRPLALLSFLLDAQDWPADARPFKYTGVLLHLLNGALLAWLLLKLGRALKKPEQQTILAAVLGAALWMLHPLFVSTTLYVVQRETTLAATFVVIGLLAFAGSRSLAASGRIAGAFLAALSIAVCTILAVLCKANGALLPLLAWLVDVLILAPSQPIDDARVGKIYRVMRWVMLVAPSVALLGYLGWIAYSGFLHGLLDSRPWSLGERLLTEAHVLSTYLYVLWLPQPFTMGLFNDGYPISHGLLSPPATLLGIMVIAALLTSAWILRQRRPEIALAILFFFAGHLLESTVVPLELYYEHRNYLPAMLLFWPLALWLCTQDAGARTPDLLGRRPLLLAPRRFLAVALPLGLAFLTFLRADLWGNVTDQALLWAINNPDSARAQANAAQIELARGHVKDATALLERALQKSPHELQLTLNLLGAKCQSGTLTQEDLAGAAIALRTARNTGRLGFDWFTRGIAIAQSNSCPLLSLDALDRLLAAASENFSMEKVGGRRQDRLHLQGRIALLSGQPEQALALFNQALDADVRPDPALAQAALLASSGYPELAKRHLDRFDHVWHPPAGPGWSMPTLHAWILWKQGYWTHEFVHMRKVLEEDIANRLSVPIENR